MATYLTETANNRTLHLLRSDGGYPKICLDASKRVKEAERVDWRNGYKTGGPNMGQEVEKANQYVEYVSKHATADNLHNFNCNGYYLFVDRG